MFFEPFWPCLSSEFPKSINRTGKNCMKKFNLGMKNAELDADFEFVEKVAKNHAKKLSTKKRWKNGVLDFY